MFIGSLLDTRANTKITYSYRKRGTDIPWNPTYKKESEDKVSYGTDDGFFSSFVGYSGYQIAYCSFDIVISLGKTCYVDNISFETMNSEIGDISALIRCGGKEKAVGLLSPQTGKTVKEKSISIPVGVYTDNLILRFTGECENIIIGKANIWGATETADAVYPIPKEIKYLGGFLKNITGIKASGTDEIFAAENFTEKYFENFGTRLTVGNGNILFSLCDMAKEEFSITVTEHGAEVKGGSRRALLYASEKLLQLCTFDGIKCAKISDAPFMGFRGIHIALPSRDQMDFLKRMVRYVFMPMGYNNVILQLSGAMKYEKHPAINDAWLEMCRKYEEGKWPCPPHYTFIGHDILSHDEVKELCDYFRAYGLEVIPEIQSFGHAQYITQAYPEMSEDEVSDRRDFDLTNEDAKPDGFYAHSMCPNHPNYYKVIFDLIDEATDVIRPEKYVHIGHDEIYTIGKCERCREIPADELYLKEVTALNEYIKSKGLTTMMWSDMLQEDTRYLTAKAIDKLSKDIVCMSFTWYFNVNIDNENILYENEYDVIIGNFYSSHFPRFNKRKYGKRLIGAQVSTWIPCNELYYGYEGKTFDFIYSAGMMWCEEYHENMRRTYTEMLKKRIDYIRFHISGSVMPENAEQILFERSEEHVPYDMRNMKASAASVGAGEEINIPIGKRADRLTFVHTTDRRGERIMWMPPQKLGEYIFEYSDGSRDSCDILYGANIAEYRRTYGKPLAPSEGISPFRHEGYFATALTTPIEGKTFDGRDITLCAMTFVNPSPEKDLSSVTLKHTCDSDVKILLFDIFVN